MAEENLYKRGETWWLRATIDGREYRESLRTRDVKTARGRRDNRLKELTTAIYRGEKKVSWKEAIIAWSLDIVHKVSADTAAGYAASLEQCGRFFENYSINEIDGKAIWEWVKLRRREGVKNATIRRNLDALSSLFIYAKVEEWREDNPTLEKRKLLPEFRDPMVLPEASDVEAVLAEAPPSVEAFTRAAWLTGCRLAEVMRIEWRHFNKKAKTLEIIGKGNKRRVIDLSEDAYAFFVSQPKILGSNLMFCDGTGAPFRGVGKELLKARRKATAKAVDEGRELIDFSLHPLRHDFAVKTLRSGKMGIYELSRHLGHTSVLTTEDNYLDYLTPSEAARIRQLDEAQQKTQPRWLQRESAQRSAQQPEDED